MNLDDEAGGLALDGSGNVYVAGTSWESSVGPYFTTIKYNSKGIPLWANTYGDPTKRYGHPYGIAVDGSGNVYITGDSTGSGTGYDFATIKY